jgi:hypothetical protein
VSLIFALLARKRSTRRQSGDQNEDHVPHTQRR